MKFAILVILYFTLNSIAFSQQSAHNKNFNYDLKYHRLVFEIDPSQYFIKGSVTSFFTFTNDNSTTMSFDLANSLNIDSVIFNKKKINTFHSNDILTINFTNAQDKKKLDSITVYYHGKPGENGFGSFSQSSHAGQPIVWTLSEPMGAKDWWPCKQSLNDKLDSVDVYIITDPIYKAASNGKLLSETFSNNKKTAHWKHRYPITAYLIAFSVTNYATYSDYAQIDGKPLEILNYVYPEDKEYVKKQTPEIVPIIELYSKLFIPYPYKDEKYGHAQFGWGGGMEHQTMSFMVSFGKALMAHELAHQWFGDWVTCGSWQDIWLNEGFATYLEGMSCEHGLGDNTWEDWKEDKINSVTSSGRGCLYVKDTTSIWNIFDSRLSYDKGAMVVHMLRWELGDSLFFKALRNYLTDKKLAGGFARTIDLQRHLESVGNRSFKKFFDNWLYGEGFPIYTLNWTVLPDNYIHLKVDQKQTDPSVSFFEMHLPIRIKMKKNDSTVVVNHTYSSEEYLIKLPQAPKQLVFDPDHWLLARTAAIKKSDEIKSVYPAKISVTSDSKNIVIKSNENIRVNSIKVFDLTGKLITSLEINQTNSKFSTGIGKIPKGQYIVLIENDSQSIIQPIVIS